MMILAPNHVFDSRAAAFEYQTGDFIFYIPFGLAPAGIVEMDLDNGKGQIPHVLCDGPFATTVAVIDGPLFDASLNKG